MKKKITKSGDLQKMTVNHSNLIGDNNMSNNTKQDGDLQKMSVNHSNLIGDNMSVKNEPHLYVNEMVNYPVNYSNSSIFELETDLSGYVQIQENTPLLQIKIWGIKDQGLILKGTMTSMSEGNRTYSGILNRCNSGIFDVLWTITGISEYVVEEIDNEYLVDVLWIKYMFSDERLEYLRLVKDYPEYRNLKLIG
jgi:hypothetical protein